jgi:calcineurin-like phosphoesterase family protein
MSLWFTADTHFGHTNIIKYSGRPYDNVEEMDEALIANWNARVHPGDIVYHLGDFAFKAKNNAIEEYIERLNGNIFLIFGNHDHKRAQKAKGFIWTGYYHQIKIQGQRIVLCHYAMRHWNQQHRGAWQLHGHAHGSLPDIPTLKQFDVGVDCWDYKPLSFEEVRAQMDTYTRKAVDHHE